MNISLKILSFSVFSNLLIGQICIAAIHIPSTGGNPGSLQFENVLVDGSSNLSANLTATDNFAIYAGQVYVLPLVELGPPSGAQDAIYNPLSQQIVSQNVMQTATLEYDITLHLTKLGLMANSLEFTITELRSKTLGDDNQLVEQVTTFMPGPQGEKGDQGEKGNPGPQGDTGPRGPKGNTGSQGPKGDTGATGPAGKDGAFPEGNAPGDIQYWNGTEWVMISADPDESCTKQLTLSNGIPRWGYQIGDKGPAGGIIFHTNGCGGLEAAPIDQMNAQWCSSFSDIDGVDNIQSYATPDSHSGAHNTPLIEAVCGPDSAAGVAANYVWPNGQTDGFLPNKEELNLLYIQKGVVGGFVDVYYWSSSEESSPSFNDLAWPQLFSSGGAGAQFKTEENRVRAVRAF